MDGDYVVAHVYFRLTMFLLSSIFVLSRSCCPLPWAATFKEIDQHVKVHGQLVAEDIDKERFRATCLIDYCGLTWTGKQSRSPISWVFNMLKTHENTQSLLTNACATMPASNGNDRQFFRYVLQRLPVFERHHLEKDISSESLIFSDMFLDGFSGGSPPPTFWTTWPPVVLPRRWAKQPRSVGLLDDTYKWAIFTKTLVIFWGIFS